MKNGLKIHKTKNINLLNELRDEIYLHTKKIFNIKEKNAELGLNYFHKYTKKLNDAALNEKRIKLIKTITNECNAGEKIFKIFEKQLLSYLGPDILVQKSCNLVLQKPGDGNPSEIHRDAPLNSPYEIVLWLPLVNCYKTKSMYILDIKKTKDALKYLNKNKNNWDNFEQYAKKLSSNPSVNYGNGLFFFTGLIHGSEINNEDETRVSLNIRYKNLFTPSGMKNQLQFFKALQISDLARMGAELEVEEYFE